jgi:hypothetical protein
MKEAVGMRSGVEERRGGDEGALNSRQSDGCKRR